MRTAARRRLDAVVGVQAVIPGGRMLRLAASAVAVLVVATGLACGDSTPSQPVTAAQQPAVTVEPSEPGILAVLIADGGSFEPIDAAAGRFRLTLTGVDARTIWFQDRPGRASGQAGTARVVDAFFRASREGPPNAAVDIYDVDAASDLVAVELSNPRYDASANILVVDAQVLADAGGGLASFASRADAALPAQFGPVAVFLDDTLDLPLEACKTKAGTDPQKIQVCTQANDAGHVYFNRT